MAIVVLTLAAYCLGQSSKLRQIFTDQTSWHQNFFQDAAISMKYDEMFQLFLLLSSILPADETYERQCSSII